ncbi:MAG TPA: efflux RND transporter periplasmic adaptor subunit [Rudaea sp.]|nr:efflux RND transporter periplasmic adaptor subunit [Rudaea sp.]
MNSRLLFLPTLVVAGLLAACSKGPQQPQQMPPPHVGVIKAQGQAVPLNRDLVGRLSASRSADVRARVAGVLLKRVYTEGADVEKGQLLFQIDPAPLQAALNAQLANLAAAQATYTNNRIAAKRVQDIAAKGLISKADLDNALAAQRTSAAAVKQAQANVASARINLGYANVTAPIAGRAGQQQVTEGALVGQGDATLLTTVEQIDPIYVNFSQAVGELEQLRRDQASGHVKLDSTGEAKIDIILADGSTYKNSGTLDFSAAAVDAATGAVTLRGSVPNPDHVLLPGMYVNVRLSLGQLNHAWLVPQPAVLRDVTGPYVYVIGGDGKVVQKHVTADSLRGGDWIVTAGLTDGDQIVVSGVQSVHVGAPAKGEPWHAPGPDASAPSKHVEGDH